MATRSIKLKLALGGEENRALRRAVWTTHRLFNEGVAYYMQWLMLMRQRPIGDEDTPNGEVLHMARSAQRANNAPSCPGSDEEILKLLRALYEEIVPSSVGKKGDANQISRNYHSILVDPASVGGLGESPGGRKPAWESMPEGPERDSKRAEWQQRRKALKDAPRAALKNLHVLPLFPAYTKTKPAWKRGGGEKKDAVLTKGDRDMFQQAIERLMSWESWTTRVADERRKKAERLDTLRAKYLDPEPAWRTRLCAYESDREERLGRDALRPESPFRVGDRMIRGWEDLQEKWLRIPPDRRTEKRLLEVVAEMQTERRGRFGDASDFFPWLARPENHFLWNESGSRTAVQQHVAINEAQRAFESAKEFANYTPPEALEHPLWARSGHSGDSNLHKYLLTETPQGLSATVRLMREEADGSVVEFDATLAVRPTGQWNRPHRGNVPPLVIVSNGPKTFHNVPEAARTGNKNDPECTWVRFTDPGTGHQMYGTLGGARLQLDRRDFRLGSDQRETLDRRRARFANGENFPRTYLNITLSLPDPKPNAGTQALKRIKSSDTEPWTANDYWLAEDKKKSCIEEVVPGGTEMTEGLRVMSVDLGVRQLAACSVFELTRSPGAGKLHIPIAGADGLFMEHRRTFLLKLPGEETSAEIDAMRDAIRRERLDLRAAVGRLARLLSLGRHDAPADKRREFDTLRGHDTFEQPDRRQGVDALLDPKALDDLIPLLDAVNDPRWPDAVLAVHRKWEAALSKAMHDWREKGRAAGRTGARRGYGGLSFWHIEELEETRKLLNAWSCHSREYETRPDGTRRPNIVRAKRRWGLRPGTRPEGQDIDARLLEHINRLKQDRLKVGADAIVMAALGHEYRDPQRGWEAVHPPCQVVLFEDLMRYRFKSDRPRRENSMLMKWAHREIPRTVAMQGEVFGLSIGTVAAEFSSKFRAHPDLPSPGVRCRLVTQELLDAPWFRQQWERDRAKGRAKDWPRPGDLVASEGGEWFCTLGPQGRLFRTHADLNAAQNLMRRFWRRRAGTFRLSCRLAVPKDGSPAVWVPKSLGKWLTRALEYDFGQGAVQLEPLDPGNIEKGCRLVPIPAAVYRRLTGARKRDGEDEAEPDDLDAAAEEVAELRGEVVNFFRDPSELVVPGQVWYPTKVFWSRVHAAVGERLVSGDVAAADDGPEDDIPM
jgi:hypothetical protein